MSAIIELQTATCSLELETRPERAVNGANGLTADAVPTEAQVLIIGTGGRKAVLVGADLIWFASDQAESLRAGIAQRTGIPEEAVVLCATHSHGTPNPDRRFAYGEWSAALVDQINAKVLAAVEAALRAPPRRVSVALGRANVPGVSINRRREAWFRRGLHFGRRVQNLPNPKTPVDDRLTVLAFLGESEGRPIALAAHFACHPVADPADRRGADFPGFLRRELHRRLNNEVVCLFLQGFCGDVRPALLHRPQGLKDRLLHLAIGGRFRPANRDDSARIGTALARHVEGALNAAKQLPSVALTFRRERLALADIDGKPTGRELDVTVWQLSNEVRLVFASGEMLSGLAPSDSRTLAVGYANGMVGYLAPAQDYAGGGYEIDGFLARFGLAKRFNPETGGAFASLVGRA